MRLYDEVYWAKYLDVLAQNRFNSLMVIFGYENGGFLAPGYPYFFDVAGFPDVRMVGLMPELQQRNLAALNRLTQMAHDGGPVRKNDRAAHVGSRIGFSLQQSPGVRSTQCGRPSRVQGTEHACAVRVQNLAAESGGRKDQRPHRPRTSLGVEIDFEFIKKHRPVTA
jgi:hypothetical protein